MDRMDKWIQWPLAFDFISFFHGFGFWFHSKRRNVEEFLPSFFSRIFSSSSSFFASILLIYGGILSFFLF